MRAINKIQFDEMIANNPMSVLDVRESWEQPRIEGEFIIELPIGRIETSLHLIPKNEDLVVVCQHGIRSTAVIDFLENHHGYSNLINLNGGLTPYE